MKIIIIIYVNSIFYVYDLGLGFWRKINWVEIMPDQVGKVLEKDDIERLAQETLNEVPDRRQDDINAIRKWIKQQPHLKKYGNTGND